MPTNPFEAFKKQEGSYTANAHTTDVYFVIGTDAGGAYLILQNTKGKAIDMPNYQLFAGVEREIVRQYAQIQEKSLFNINWEQPHEYIYLHEHPYLMHLLKRSKLLRVEGQLDKPILLEDGLATLVLDIAPIEKSDPVRYQCQWKLNHQLANFKVLTESFLLVENRLLEVMPLGDHAPLLQVFNTRVYLEDLAPLLSLLYSYISNIGISMEAWELKRETTPLEARPCIVFEKIDVDKSLYMRVANALSFLPPDFLEKYDLDYVVKTDENGQRLLLYPLSYNDHSKSVAEIEKSLRKHKRKDSGNYLLQDNLFVMEEDLAGAFIFNELPKLLEQYQIMGAEKLKDYKVTTYAPSLQVNLSSGIDFLEGSASLKFGNEDISLLEVLRQFGKQRYVTLSDGTKVLLNQGYIDKLERIFKKKKGKGDNIEVSFFDLPLIEDLMEERIAAEAFKKSRKIFEGFNALKTSKKRLPKVEATLRPYQKDGIRWLMYLQETGLGGCLADDMGLGKTLQAISLLAGSYPKESKPSLIVMPRSLLFNWESEVRKFAPQISTYTFYGNQRDWEEASKANLIFITYGLLRNVIEEVMDKEFHYVILDESQNIKNINSQTHKAAALLKANHRLALSGTPIENNLSELYALFHFLNPAMFGTWNQFSNEYLYPVQKHGEEQAAKDLRKKIYPFILRRLKRDVLKDLPPKIEQVLYVEMEGDQARLYEQRRQFYHQMIQQEVAINGVEKSQFLIFQAMNELRQIASIPEAQTDGRIQSPKKELMEEHLADAFANGHKVLVFANFLVAVDEICQLLEKIGVDYVSMTGATRNRQELVDRFQNDKQCQAFVMTLKTGGTGLNLTEADMVFIFDPWWNVAAENQAIDRAHRIGQQHSVTAYKLIVKDSIEEKILLLQEQKKQLVEQIISTDGAAIKSLTTDDIDFMLG